MQSQSYSQQVICEYQQANYQVENLGRTREQNRESRQRPTEVKLIDF